MSAPTTEDKALRLVKDFQELQENLQLQGKHALARRVRRVREDAEVLYSACVLHVGYDIPAVSSALAVLESLLWERLQVLRDEAREPLTLGGAS